MGLVSFRLAKRFISSLNSGQSLVPRNFTTGSIMSTPRLLFLYPPLWKSISPSEPRIVPQVFLAKRPSRSKCFHKLTDRRQDVFPQRYGPAAEQSSPAVSVSSDVPKISLEKVGIEKTAAKADNSDGKNAADKGMTKESLEIKEDAASDIGILKHGNTKQSLELDAEAVRTKDIGENAGQNRTNKPFEKVLHMEPPTSTAAEEHKTPHLHAPPYVHHFDTYGLVKDLEIGGFTQDQSVTLMKAVRGLLATNLDVAKEGLVSKSDIENVRDFYLLHFGHHS